MQKIIENFIQELKNTIGTKLKSVILYGSKASQEDTKYSDYNILIIIEELKFDNLKLLVKPFHKWLKEKNTPPLVFDTKMFYSSIDVFPIEFLDIKQNHKVLYGDDPFENLEIDLKNLRHECEFELKSKLLKLRQAYIITKGNKRKIKRLLIDTISTFLVLFKSVLHLVGKTPPVKKVEVLNMIKDFIDIDVEPFEKILHLKQNIKEAKKYDVEELFEKYVEQIEKIISYVDKFK
ncbi:MAG: nucleotidyltransferase domain-containing protein [Endomicrobia bacterium]|nr:nucleotidyltransferase domain-containing protein [Endomicrobiia bacterium]MDW8056633.1 nucleotidyltransferase domain-containing protein [Elusimicrobiota bacterium]